MIGLDTNVVLRYLLQDDPVQTRRANRVFEHTLSDRNPGYLNLATVFEIVWVLRSLLKQPPAQIALHVENLLAADCLVIQNEQPVMEAVLALKNGGGEFEDALIGALNVWAGCSTTLTFDRKAVRLPTFQVVNECSERNEYHGEKYFE